MSVLSICQSALGELGISCPATIVGNTDPDATQLYHLLIATARDLRNDRVFPFNKRSYSFDTVSGQALYALPRDFYSPLTDTQFNDDARRPLRIESDAEMVARKKLFTSSSTEYGYRVIGISATHNAQIELEPTPAANGITLSFEYVSTRLFYPPVWQASTVYAASAYCSYKGEIFQTLAGGTSGATPPTHTSGSETDGGVTWANSNAVYEAPLTDSDLEAYELSIMIAGLKWRWLRAKKKDYAQELADAEALLDGTVARWNGTTIGSMAGESRTRRYGPLTPGGWSL